MATDEEAFVYVPMNGSKKDCPNQTNSTRAEQSLQGVAQVNHAMPYLILQQNVMKYDVPICPFFEK